MKTLLLLRHAKSSWKNSGVADHDRPLNARGKHDAPRIGELIKAQQLVPELILSSTAKRARKTAAIVAEHCGYEGVIELRKEIYEANPKTLLKVLAKVDDKNERVMLVGHNPGLEELLFELTGADEHLSTAALANVGVAIAKWSAIDGRTAATLGGIWRPRELD